MQNGLLSFVKLHQAPNNALVSDACAAALRAFFSAAQRARSAQEV
jgi:hypothetical protein